MKINRIKIVNKIFIIKFMIEVINSWLIIIINYND